MKKLLVLPVFLILFLFFPDRLDQEPCFIPVWSGRVTGETVSRPGEIPFILDGYSGYISLETHWRATEILSKDELDRPGGGKFSEGGEYASGVCIKNIQEMLSQL